jgi:membrane protease YdiL (CAAX protease family)
MPSATQVALAVLGPLAHAGSWWLVRTRRVSIWVGSGVTLAVLGVAAVIVGPVVAAERFDVAGAVGLGALAGVLLWAATAAFMAVAVRTVPTLAAHTSSLYGERGDRSLAAALAVPLLLSAPGEELLWRGVVFGALDRSLDGPALAALVCWAAFAVVNVVSGSLPIILGAVVGGAVWTALAWWTGGVAASVACHIVWTGLMIVAPPRGARA